MDGAVEIMKKGGILLGEKCPRCGGVQMKYKGQVICINEDNNYPDGLGGQYFINCIQEIYNKKEITDRIKEKYKL